MAHYKRNLITDEDTGHRFSVYWHKDKQLFAICTTTQVPTEENENYEFVDLWLTKEQMIEMQNQINAAVERSSKQK